MAKRASSSIPAYRARRSRSGGGIVRMLFRVMLGAVLLSVLWVVAYRFINPPLTATMASDIIAGRGADRSWMGLDRVDRDVVRAAIGAEDSKYCSHNGFDVDAIEDAMKRNASGGRIRGGSTISQQTAKNVFLWQGGGYVRKGAEAWFTFLIEHLWGKRRIIEVYLNVAETGIGTYGVNAGSIRYFGHDASAMTPTEAARIAAVLPLPKQRGAIAPKGFTRRYGNAIAARIGLVGRDGLDSCVYKGFDAPIAKSPRVTGRVRPVPGAEYETATPPLPAGSVDDRAGSEPLDPTPAPSEPSANDAAQTDPPAVPPEPAPSENAATPL